MAAGTTSRLRNPSLELRGGEMAEKEVVIQGTGEIELGLEVPFLISILIIITDDIILSDIWMAIYTFSKHICMHFLTWSLGKGYNIG